MRLTSMDITNKEFRKSIRGFDCDEVDEFLDKVSEDYELLFKENSSMKEKIQMLTEQIESYSKMQSTIQNTLILAQEASEQAKNSAQKEGDLIIKNANESAKRILDKAHNEVLEITEQYEKMKAEFLQFKTKFRSFMNSQMDLFENLDKEFEKNYKIGKEVSEDINMLKEIEELPKKDGELKEEFKINDTNFKDIEESNTFDEIKNFFSK